MELRKLLRYSGYYISVGYDGYGKYELVQVFETDYGGI